MSSLKLRVANSSASVIATFPMELDVLLKKSESFGIRRSWWLMGFATRVRDLDEV
jgi:hypothetical protein